jgi:hypothetical protein
MRYLVTYLTRRCLPRIAVLVPSLPFYARASCAVEPTKAFAHVRDELSSDDAAVIAHEIIR